MNPGRNFEITRGFLPHIDQESLYPVYRFLGSLGTAHDLHQWNDMGRCKPVGDENFIRRLVSMNLKIFK